MCQHAEKKKAPQEKRELSTSTVQQRRWWTALRWVGRKKGTQINRRGDKGNPSAPTCIPWIDISASITLVPKLCTETSIRTDRAIVEEENTTPHIRPILSYFDRTRTIIYFESCIFYIFSSDYIRFYLAFSFGFS